MAIEYPKACSPEIVDPKIIMDAPTRRISFKTPQRVRTRPEVLPIKNTTDMFKKNAMHALAKNVQRPTAYISVILTRGNSQKRATVKFMTAQTGAK